MTGIDEIDRLATMFAVQRKFQHRLNGYDVDDQNVVARIDNYKVSHLALIDELFEALHEMGWKEWAKSRHFNSTRIKGELIDAWHFFMNLCLHAGMTPDELYMGYLEKQRINNLRQDQGYDGVTTKCPACKSAYDEPYRDDAGVSRCQPSDLIAEPHRNRGVSWCSMAGFINGSGERMQITSHGDWVLVDPA